tara:strand:+ start:566 stop:739 length:174 start_codon:yes stop_codon:yes gene_type:complete
MAIYKLKKSELQSEASSVLLDDGSGTVLSIPLSDPYNTDYIEYKAWCDAGNTPDPLD